MHGLMSSANGVPQCAFRMTVKSPFPAQRPPCSQTGAKPFPMADNFPMQRLFLRAAPVPPNKRAPWMFFQWAQPILVRAGGQGHAGGATQSEKYLMPLYKRVITCFQRRAKGRLSAAAHGGLHNGTQAVTQTGRPQRCAHLPKDDKRPVSKRDPGPFPKSDMNHLQARFEICPNRAGQTCICRQGNAARP
jgi:hypothetical protein